MFSGALCFAELGTLILESGAEYAYMKVSMGRGLAFTYSWTYCLLAKPAALSIVCLTCAQYMVVPFFDDGCGSPPNHIVVTLAITVIRKTKMSWHPRLSH